MGFNDRDYSRDEQSGYQLRAPSTAVGLLLLANIAIFLVDYLVVATPDPVVVVQGAPGVGGDVERLLVQPKPTHPISDAMALRADLFQKPWQVWQLFTYGFFHSTSTVWHLLGNMFMLWMFGSDLEAVYGKREFLRIYFVAQVVAGLAWVASCQFIAGVTSGSVIGASGAVSGVIMIFVFLYPRRTLLFWGILPVPVWLFGIIWLLGDISGLGRSVRGGGDNVAYAAHLGGALVGALYYRFSWNFGRWLPESISFPKFGGSGGFGRKPKLRVHQPPADEPPRSMEAEVDRLLAKITDSGYDSLSEDEKRTLEKASSRYQRRRGS